VDDGITSLEVLSLGGLSMVDASFVRSRNRQLHSLFVPPPKLSNRSGLEGTRRRLLFNVHG
jgi:hypothetical protein